MLADEQRGRTQDFVMINHPVFSPGTKDYLRLEQVLVQADDNRSRRCRGALRAATGIHFTGIGTDAGGRPDRGTIPAHPASITYFSMAPIRFGNFVAKYRAKPAGDRHESYLDLVQRLGSQADAMRLGARRHAGYTGSAVRIPIATAPSEQSMPIEDASVEWPERESPYRTVGHVLLPRQKIAVLRQHDAYQNLSFNVWHGLAAHRPLGGINRVRRRAYALSCAWRRQQAGAEVGTSAQHGRSLLTILLPLVWGQNLRVEWKVIERK